MEITPGHRTPAPADLAADLRALADLIDNDSDGFTTAILHRILNRDVFPSHVVAPVHDNQNREVMAEAIRRFKTVATGPIKKKYHDYGDGYFEAVIPLRAISVTLTDQRDQVCERIVTGTTTVTETVPDPEYIAAAPKVTVSREVETVEWKCGPVLS